MRAFIFLLILLSAEVAYAASASPQLPAKAVTVADKYLGVREKTGHNDHPLIDKWVAGVELNNQKQYQRTGTGYSWCAAFVHGMYQEAADLLRIKNPMPPIAGVQNLWYYAKNNKLRFETIKASYIIAGLERVKPGDVMIIIHSGGAGHTGLGKGQASNHLAYTIEGNTNKAGSREGDGVYNKTRSIDSLAGFIRVR